jgi:hypothetical protein
MRLVRNLRTGPSFTPRWASHLRHRDRPALEFRNVLRVGLVPQPPGGCPMSLFPRRNYPAVCRSCGSTIYRSKRKGFIESFLHHILFVSPYRCVGCDERQLRFRLAQHSTPSPKHAA